MATRQDACFYVNGQATESLWEGERYAVIRNGDLRLVLGDDVCRYTQDLERHGIDTDSALENLLEGTEFLENPWFEVVDTSDPTDEGEVYDYLDDAVERAQTLEARQRGDMVS
jgi:hypothetical protein